MEAEERYKIQKRNDVASILKMQQAENARLIEEHAQKMRAANLPKSIPPSAIKEFAPKIKPPEKMRINSHVRKVEAVRWEMPKPATPQRNITVEKKFIDGRQHTIKTVERFDKNGNFTRRDIVDRVRLDKRTILTTVKTYSPSGDLIRQIEKFKTKAKGGYQIQKFVSTQFDVSGNPLDRRQVTNKFVHKRTFGSILGAALTFGIVGGIIAAADPNFFPKFFQTGLGKIVGIGVQAVGALTGNPLAIAANQFALGLAQGEGFKGALISAGISFGAYIVTAGIANFLQGADFNALGKIGGALKIFGKNLATNLAPTQFSGSPTALFHSLLGQMAIRAGGERFGEAFGKKLGAFGTAATISFAAAVAGAFAQNNFSPSAFSQLSPQGFADIALRAAAQGGIAEAFKHERGLAAQFAREVASLSTAGLNTEVIKQGFQGVGKSFADIAKLFDPRTATGKSNMERVGQILAAGSPLDNFQPRKDANNHFYTLPKGAHEVYSREGDFLYSASPSGKQNFNNIYDWRGQVVGRAPVDGTIHYYETELPIIGKGAVFLGSSKDTAYAGVETTFYYNEQGNITHAKHYFNDGTGRDLFTGRAIPGMEQKKGFLAKHLTTFFGNDRGTIDQLEQRLSVEKNIKYYDETLIQKDSGTILKAPNTFNGRKVEYTAYAFDRSNKTLNLISEYVAGMKAGLPESSLTSYKPPQDELTKTINNVIEVAQGLKVFSDSIKSVVELNTYRVVLTTQDDKDPRVTVYKPNLGDIRSNNISSLYGDKPIRGGITYTALPENGGLDILLGMLRRDQ